MKRTTRNPTRSRQEIIEKSAPIFNVHGYAGTSMQMLVDATGFQMGGIYRHFGSKRDLAIEAYRYTFRNQVMSNLEVDNNLDARAQLNTIFHNYKKMITRPFVKGGCPLLNTTIEVDDTDSEFLQIIKKHAAEIVVIITQILEKGQKEGIFKKSMHANKEALFLFASIEGAIFLAQITKNLKSASMVFDRIENYLEEHIFTN